MGRNPWKKRIWFYRPYRGIGWWNLRPVWFGNDEFHRKTIVLGFPWTGEAVIALWHFKQPCECEPFWFCPTCTAMLDRYRDYCYTCDNPATE